MSIYLQRNAGDDTIIGIWKIEETWDKREQIRHHRITTQQLLRHLLSSKPEVKINYDTNGKPFLPGSEYKISISHSNKLVAIQLSKIHAGVDIQQIGKKIERIAEKFMSERELISLKGNNQVEQLHVYWGAKEVLYKIYGKRALHFKENLLIEPFEYKAKEMITGHVFIAGIKKTYSLYYEKIGNYMLVFVNN